MFPGKIFEQSSGNDDTVFFDFFWHIINTIYFNVTKLVYFTKLYTTNFL